MRHFQKPILFTLLVIINNIFCPKGYAQDHQPEVSSFETISNTDMVNLSTGDFVYTLPVLQVPGANGGYTVSLNYHGDIKANQKTSWVGLGWNINPGSILRSVSGVADDYSGAEIQNSLDNPGTKGYSRSNFLYTQNYDNNEGLSYSTELLVHSLEWDQSGITDFETWGVHWDFKKNTTYFDGEEMASDILKVALRIASAGTSESAEQAANALGTINTMYNVYSSAKSIQAISQFMNYSSNSELWYSRRSTGMLMGGLWDIFTAWDHHLVTNVKDSVYGSLYLQDFGGETNGEEIDCSNTKSLGLRKSFKAFGYWVEINGRIVKVSKVDPGRTLVDQIYHDAFMYVDGEADEYLWSKNPSRITYDNYLVQGGSVSGAIQPYRTQVASIVTNKQTKENITSKAIRNFLNDDVGFRYLGALNYYDYHFNYNESLPGIENFTFNDEEGRMEFDLTDKRLYCKPFAPDRDGFRNNKLYGGNDIRWYSHKDLLSGEAQAEGFMDYVPGHFADKNAFRNYCSDMVGDGSFINKSGIGGFMITSTDGISYHYALPVYTLKEKTESKSGQTKSTTTSLVTNNNKYANNWLLTTITGPDYYDYNNNGIADKGDWGYWITFNYSRYKNNFVTKTPESGYVYDASLSTKTKTETVSEIYYLDFISTNTHVAAFIKSLKGGRDQLYKLDAIRLYALDDFINGVSEGYNYSNIPGCIKETQFTYNYNLAPDYNGLGLLTLESVNTLFGGGQKIFPPYKFEYKNNPAYSSEYWDGWNKYNSNATSETQLGRLPSATSKGDEWSLTSIIAPIGAQINIDYERDDYSTVMGNNVEGYSIYPQYDKDNGSLLFKLERTSDYYTKLIFNDDNFAHGAQPGDLVTSKNIKIKYNKYTWSIARGKWYWKLAESNLELTANSTNRITSAETNSITFNYLLPQGNLLSDLETTYKPGSIKYDNFRLDKFDAISFSSGNLKEHLGGGNRVSQIEITDGHHSNKTRYIYTLNEEESGISSGYCTMEPRYCRSNANHYFTKEEKFGMPAIELAYSKVTVLSDYISNDNYKLKTVYNYEPPQPGFYKLNTDKGACTIEDGPFNGNSRHIFKLSNYVLKDYTSKIGRINSIVEYNLFGDIIRGANYGYDNSTQHGKITHGTIVFEEGFSDNKRYDRLFRTTIVEYPNILAKVTTMTPTSKSSVTYGDVDVISNQFLSETHTNENSGVSVEMVKVPAYKVYPKMGHKSSVDDNSCSNMLIQNVATLSLKNGSPVDVSIQTWNNDWDNYLEWNTTSGEPEWTGGDPGRRKVWRKHKTFTWSGNIDDNGFLDMTGFSDYSGKQNIIDNWYKIKDETSGNHDSLWVKSSEVVRYDHFSTPVEVKDINGDYAATKKDANDIYTIATAANSSLASFTATSFEDKVEHSKFTRYGGQVISMNSSGADIVGIRVVKPHTGHYSLKIPSGQVGCKYLANGSNLIKGETYQASVWVHKNLIKNISLDYKVDGTTQANAQKTVGTFGYWTLVSLEFDLPATATSFEVFVQAKGGTCYIDDFRVSPLEAAVTSYTYDNAGNVTAILNNDNFATKYEYDKAGRLVATYIEKSYGFMKASGTTYNYAEQFNIVPNEKQIIPWQGVTNKTFNVNAENSDWTIYKSGNWIELEKGYNTLTMKIAPIGCQETRSGFFRVTSAAYEHINVYVEQEQKPALPIMHPNSNSTFNSKQQIIIKWEDCLYDDEGKKDNGTIDIYWFHETNFPTGYKTLLIDDFSVYIGSYNIITIPPPPDASYVGGKYIVAFMRNNEVLGHSEPFYVNYKP